MSKVVVGCTARVCIEAVFWRLTAMADAECLTAQQSIGIRIDFNEGEARQYYGDRLLVVGAGGDSARRWVIAFGCQGPTNAGLNARSTLLVAPLPVAQKDVSLQAVEEVFRALPSDKDVWVLRVYGGRLLAGPAFAEHLSNVQRQVTDLSLKDVRLEDGVMVSLLNAGYFSSGAVQSIASALQAFLGI